MDIFKKKMDRKEFLKAVAKTGSVAVIGTTLQPALRAFSASSEAAATETGVWKPTTCQGCTSWCALQIYVENGRAIKVRGNPKSQDTNDRIRETTDGRTVWDI